MKKNLKLYVLIMTLLMALLIGCSNEQKEQGQNGQHSDATQKQVTQNNEDKDVEDVSDNKPESQPITFPLLDIDRDDYENPDPNFVKSRGFLYKLQNQKNNSTVYLLGSIHIYKEEYYPLSDAIMNAYNESKSLTYEILNADTPSTEDLQYVVEKSMYKNDVLKNHVSEALYEKLKKVQEKFEFPPAIVTQYTPAFASLNLEVYLSTLQGHNALAGIEGFFGRRALRDKKPEYQIESLKSQIDMLASMSDETQIQMLEETVDHALEIDKDAFLNEEQDEGLFHYWYLGDEEKIMSELTNSSLYQNQEYIDKMINHRNELMAKYVEKMLEEKADETNMVIVGALHVIGKGGIVDLLDEKGYSIERQ